MLLATCKTLIPRNFIMNTGQICIHQLHTQTMPVQMHYLSPVASKGMQGLSWDDKLYLEQFKMETW